MPRAFVVDLLEDTGRMGRGEAELLLSIFEWVEAEALGSRRCWSASAGCEGLW